MDDIAINFFDAFRELDTDQRETAVIECASSICIEVTSSNESTENVIENIEELRHNVRRVRFAIEILNETNLSRAIEPSMVGPVERGLRQKTKYIPLIGSFNHLQSTACAVEEDPSPENVKEFLIACMAFGLEVAMWQSHAPYQMAWTGTRFVSNRSFLRYANSGCNNCIALVMSELHWALRALPYNLASPDSITFVFGKLEQLEDEAATTEGYQASGLFDEEAILELLDESPPAGAAVIAERRSNTRILGDRPLVVILLVAFIVWIVSRMGGR